MTNTRSSFCVPVASELKSDFPFLRCSGGHFRTTSSVGSKCCTDINYYLYMHSVVFAIPIFMNDPTPVELKTPLWNFSMTNRYIYILFSIMH